MAKQYKRDFFEEARQILKATGYKNYIQRLLPDGKQRGREWVAKDPTRNDKRAGSLSINVDSGKWGEFAVGKAGNDLIGLTAYIKGISPLEACFYIGVPRPDSKNSDTEYFEPIPDVNLNSKGEHTTKSPNNAPESSNEELEDIPAEDDDIDDEVHNDFSVPEFTENLIGRKIKDRFKGGIITLYPYHNSKGVPVGCVIRCDFNVAGDKQKSFAQYSYDFEQKKWKSGWSKKGKPIYNLQELVANPDKPVMIVEGEKKVKAAKILFPEFVPITSCGGGGSASSTNWSFLKDRDVTIAPDNDDTGSRYIRDLKNILTKVEVKSFSKLDTKKLGCFTVVDGKLVKRENPNLDKYDLADSVNDGWTAELIEEHKNHADFRPFFEAVIAEQIINKTLQEGEEAYCLEGVNYILNKSNNSLWWERVTYKKSGEVDATHWLFLSGYVKPTHCMVDADGNHGFLVKMITRRGKEVECFFTRAEVAADKDTIKLLLDKGLKIPNPKYYQGLNHYLNNFEPEFKAVGVDMVGWQSDLKTYMLPFADDARNSYTSTEEGKQPITYILQQKGEVIRMLSRKGTLEEWKRTVGAVICGNHLHSFAIITALTPPALKLLGEEGGFIHYMGNTSLGKSTILRIVMSVWGFTNLEVFRKTDNSLESYCKNTNDGMLFLDEIAQVEPDALDKAIYMVANGVTKGRADRSGNAKAVAHFRVIAQCTGEIGLEAKLAEKNKPAKGGQLIRMAEIDADRRKGLATFDVLNTNPDTKEVFVNGAEQAQYLEDYAKENYGIVIDEFLKKVVPKVQDYKDSLKQIKANWLERKFSTIYASGVLASEFGIIPHSIQEIEECIDAIFINWRERFGCDSYELKTIEARLRRLIFEERARFCNAHPTPDERENLPRDKAGYYKTKEITIDRIVERVPYEFWIYPQVFEREVLKGQDSKVFYPLLVKEGYLIKGEGNHYKKKERPSKEKSDRFIVINVATFHKEND